MKLKEIEKQIKVIKERVFLVGAMRPGSLSKQYSVCGKKNCRCVDPKKQKKHGPYYKLSYVQEGKNTTRFVRPKFYKQIKREIDQYRQFQSLLHKWVSLAIDQSQERMNEEKKTDSEMDLKKLKS